MIKQLAAVVLALAFLLTGCGKSDSGDSKPKADDNKAALAKAKKLFDEASSVHIALSTDSTPKSGTGVLGAEGVLTHQPAFEGKVKIQLGGLSATIPATAVDGKVYAQIPPFPKPTLIDPAEYGAPNPAGFVDPNSGISSLASELNDLKKGDQIRDGKLVLTQYTGNLPGSKVKAIIPSAQETSKYATKVGIDQEGFIRTIKVTGNFFAEMGDVTYDVKLTDYGKAVTVKKPAGV